MRCMIVVGLVLALLAVPVYLAAGWLLGGDNPSPVYAILAMFGGLGLQIFGFGILCSLSYTSGEDDADARDYDTNPGYDAECEYESELD